MSKDILFNALLAGRQRNNRRREFTAIRRAWRVGAQLVGELNGVHEIEGR